jgi:creatinine amidohydrolase
MWKTVIQAVLVVLLVPNGHTVPSGVQDEGAQRKAGFPVQYEELTSPQFVEALNASDGICMIPLGILEKHGTHLPLGTDLLNSREVAMRAAREEYCVVFPEYYAGQIFEAKHQPGTIAYSHNLMWLMLQETCDELARNGFKKIVLVNGHGGNNSFLEYFCQSQLSARRDYIVALFSAGLDPEVEQRAREMRKTTTGGHADEVETSMVLAHRPELVDLDKAAMESGADQNRLTGIPYLYTGIWWYARYPNHYAGDGSSGNRELGELYLSSRSRQLATMIKALKSDRSIQELQDRFHEKARRPTPDRN